MVDKMLRFTKNVCQRFINIDSMDKNFLRFCYMHHVCMGGGGMYSASLFVGKFCFCIGYYYKCIYYDYRLRLQKNFIPFFYHLVCDLNILESPRKYNIFYEYQR